MQIAVGWIAVIYINYYSNNNKKMRKILEFSKMVFFNLQAKNIFFENLQPAESGWGTSLFGILAQQSVNVHTMGFA